jgi:hypothetical protein
MFFLNPSFIRAVKLAAPAFLSKAQHLFNPRTLKRGQKDPKDYLICYIYSLRLLTMKKF